MYSEQGFDPGIATSIGACASRCNRVVVLDAGSAQAHAAVPTVPQNHGRDGFSTRALVRSQQVPNRRSFSTACQERVVVTGSRLLELLPETDE